MQHELNHTVQELLGARGLDDVSRETLAALVREYPYSALLHLLYSKKLQQSQDPQYADSVARTALYFSNPHWLHHLLRPKSSREAVREMEKAFADHVQEVPAAEPGQPVVEETAEPHQADAGIQTAETEQPVEAAEETASAFVEAEEPLAHGTAVEIEPSIDEQAAYEPEDHTTADTTPAVAEPEIPAPADTSPVPTEPDIPTTPELTAVPGEQDIPTQPELTAVPGEEDVPSTPEVTEAPAEPSIQEIPVWEKEAPVAQWQAPDIRPLEATPEAPEIDIPSPEPAETETAPTVAVPASSTQAPVPASPPSMPAGPVVPADTGLIPLEPYYTIDYFASQGIQLSEEEKLDPLGRKLKRFTDWLKTMKKIHPDKSRPVEGGDHADDTIRQGAEHSNDRAEVITEAMAEVYLKQGQKAQAAEIYRKLSLLDPSRSATFAAKIADLNTPDA